MNEAKTLRGMIAVLALFAFSGCSEVSNREDFTSQLKNKTETEVVKFVGKPVEVDRKNPSRVVYVYKSRTFDVTTRKTDAEANVIFTLQDDGKLHVADVVFK